jgi:hypothetical protein
MRVESVVDHALAKHPIVTVDIVARYNVGTRPHIQQVLDRLVRLGTLRKWESHPRNGRSACYFPNRPDRAT